jgi:hypothetical protein
MEKQIRRQINAINKAITEGRVKNLYAAKNKVNNLKIRLEMYQRAMAFKEYISQ